MAGPWRQRRGPSTREERSTGLARFGFSGAIGGESRACQHRTHYWSRGLEGPIVTTGVMFCPIAGGIQVYQQDFRMTRALLLRPLITDPDGTICPLWTDRPRVFEVQQEAVDIHLF